ncbi:tyrosine-type recombinase/integrase [Sediminibacillus terrae]|uniref:tyrosine-type recombinase/integrase n=1 Tax=Sediminibacillus terrae TaxID=1562106 RepID=UPI0012976808|nr:tyrosine-type recombinase/integrase [Sediminibacillus terrae]
MSKLSKSKKDPELYYYFSAKGEKRWMYRHSYKDYTGKWKEKKKQGFTSEKEAYRSLLEVKTKSVDGYTKEIDHSNITVSKWFNLWYETNKNDWKVTSRQQREMAIRIAINPLLGHYKLHELDKTTYKRVFVNMLLKSYKPSTVQLFHTLFKIGVNAAVDDEILARNRFTKISINQNLIEEDKLKGNFLSADELHVLLKDAEENENITVYTLLLLLAYTGLRRGEAFGLKWDNIDFKEKTLTVERTRDNKGVRSPKTNNSYRTISIDDKLINQLQLYKTWCKETKLSFGRKLRQDDFIFISFQTGKEYTDASILYALRRCIKRTGISSITPHGLRHTHATLLINQGVGVKYVAERLGNTPMMILDIYGHTFKEVEREIVDMFSASMNEVSAKFSASFGK